MAVASVPLIVNVPETVTGPPVNVMPVVPPEAFTLVTVPAPVTVYQEGSALAPPVRKSCPDKPGASADHDDAPR